MNLPLVGAAIAVVPLSLGGRSLTASEVERDLADLMPASTLVYAEGPGLSALFDEGLRHPFLATLLESELGKLALANAERTPEEAIAIADQYLGRPVLPALASLTSRGVAFGVGVKRGKPVFTLIARGNDPELGRDTMTAMLAKVAEQHGVPPDSLAEPHETVRGVDVWFLGDAFTLALAGDLFMASNDEGRVRDVIDLRAAGDSPAGSLGAGERFRSVRASRTGGELAWAWLDVATLEGLDPSSVAKLRKLATNPGAQFLLGPVVTALGASRETTVALRLEARRLALRVSAVGPEEGGRAAVTIPLATLAPALPADPGGEGARAMLYRDLAGLFEHRADLFPAGALPGFANAISGLAFLFSGQDVSEAILPSISPWIGLVVRDAEFAEGAVPDVPLPAAALIARISDPEHVGQQLVGAFNNAIGLINIDGAQKMRPTMILDIELVGDVNVNSAHFIQPHEGEGVDMRFNLAPACALVEDSFVLGSHVSLVRQLVRQLERGEVQPASGAGEHLSLSGPILAETLRANTEALVMNAVLKEGKSMEQARGEIAGMTQLAELLRQVRVSTDRPSAERTVLSLDLELVE